MLSEQNESDGSTTLTVATAIYPLEAIQKAAHKLTALCSIGLTEGKDGQVLCNLKPRAGTQQADLTAAFANELLDQALRLRLRGETEVIRRLILAQAFSRTEAASYRATD